MFDIGWSELLLVLVVALVVVGPKDLPRLIRMVGRWVGKARRMADQFRAGFDELTRETELDELRREISALRGHNPVTRFQEEFNRSILRAGAPAATPVSESPSAGGSEPKAVTDPAPPMEAAEPAAAPEPDAPPRETPAAGATPTGP
jgi:sec-independent protein translocase protein TatB